MSRARHRRLQKTRKRYERVVRGLLRWPHPLGADLWAYLRRWAGHGPRRRPATLELVFSIPPGDTPFGQMLGSSDERFHQWMKKKAP